MSGTRQDRVLKSVTGLEGGAVASGSTCGVLSGGALGIALMHRESLRQYGVQAAAAVMEEAGRYVDWFGEAFGATTRRARTGGFLYSIGPAALPVPRRQDDAMPAAYRTRRPIPP